MVDYVVDLAAGLAARRIIAVVGWQKQTVIEHLQGLGKEVLCVEQIPQLGTGHAVMQAEGLLRSFTGDVLVLSGDVPLLSLGTVRALLACHRESAACATVLTAELDNPSGYGRVLRNADGTVQRIVEHRDATAGERSVREINSGVYVFHAPHLFAALKQITPSNAQKEYYLTDVFDYFRRNKLPVAAVKTGSMREIQGINTPEQLEEARSAFA
jgi:UDP-N-acetylglucosamine pyrophosphorylase